MFIKLYIGFNPQVKFKLLTRIGIQFHHHSVLKSQYDITIKIEKNN